MAVKYELMAPVGSYQKDGETKTRWLKCGAIFTGDNGPKIKIDCTPTSVIDRDGNSVAWNGWLNAFEPRQRDSQPRQAPQSTGVDSNDDRAKDRHALQLGL